MVVWSILLPFGIFYGHLVMLWKLGIVSPVLVYCFKKNLATLIETFIWQGSTMELTVGGSAKPFWQPSF
jgi:hypothetical protein